MALNFLKPELTHFLKQIIVLVLITPFTKSSFEFPSINVGTDQEYGGKTTMHALVNLSQVISIPVVVTNQYEYSKIRFECKASYPIEWIYNYNEEHAIYYTHNLQYSPVERQFNETDFMNPNTFKYDATLGISPHYNFKDSPELFTCRSVANRTLFRTVQAHYEPRNATTNTGNMTQSTTSTPSTTTLHYNEHHTILNENLIVRLINVSNPDYGEDPFQTGLGNGSLACPAYLVVREEGSYNLPEWSCESGTGRSDEDLNINFAYCHEGMTCQNLFRTVKNQRACVKIVARNASLASSAMTTSFVSPQSYEPGTAYCSANGSIVVAQQFFYSMPPMVDQIPQHVPVTPTQSPVWSNGANQRFPDFMNTYNLHFQWNEVNGSDMIFMHQLKHGGFVVENDLVEVRCRFSVYYFALGYRIGLMFNNNTVQLRPYNYGYYDQRSNAIVVRDKVPVPNRNLTRIFCFGPVWNSTEWANVSRSVSYKEPIAPKFKPNYVEVNAFTETQTSLSCELDALPAPNVTWFRLMRDNSTPSSWEWGLGYHPYHDDRNGNSKMQIYRVTFPRHGFYKCLAQNYVGSDTKYFKLNVHSRNDYILEGLHSGFSNLTFYVDETNISLEKNTKVVYKGEVKAQWWWKEPLVLNDTSRIRTGDKWEFHEKIQLKDAGTYIHEVITDFGVKTTKFYVQVKEPVKPSFSSDHKTTIVYQGLSKRFENVAEFCPDVSGDPTPEVTVRNEKTGQPFDLTNPGADDSVRHICTATSRIGSASLVVNIKVKKPTPPYFKKIYERWVLNLSKANSLTLNCDAEGDPQPTQITWYKNHYVLQDTEAELETTSPSFTIKVLTKFDEGKYICQASSDAGSAQKIFIVEIEDPPTEPTPTTPTVKPTTVTPAPTASPTAPVTQKVVLPEKSKSTALVTTTVLLGFITIIGFGIFIWKIYNQRKEIRSLILKQGSTREESPDNWYQLNSSSTQNLQAPAHL